MEKVEKHCKNCFYCSNKICHKGIEAKEIPTRNSCKRWAWHNIQTLERPVKLKELYV